MLRNQRFSEGDQVEFYGLRATVLQGSWNDRLPGEWVWAVPIAVNGGNGLVQFAHEDSLTLLERGEMIEFRHLTDRTVRIFPAELTDEWEEIAYSSLAIRAIRVEYGEPKILEIKRSDEIDWDELG